MRVLIALAVAALMLVSWAAAGLGQIVSEDTPDVVVREFYQRLVHGDDSVKELLTEDTRKNVDKSLAFFKSQAELYEADASGLKYQVAELKGNAAKVRVTGAIVLSGNTRDESVTKDGRTVPVTGGGRQTIKMDGSIVLKKEHGGWKIRLSK